MRILILAISTLPFLTSVALLSDFVTQTDQVALTVKSKYHSTEGNGWSVNFSEGGYCEIDDDQINLIEIGDLGQAEVGKYSDTILSIQFPKQSIKIGITTASKYMLGINLAVLLMSIIGFLVAVGVIKINPKEYRFWAIYGSLMLVGHGLGTKLIMVQVGYLDKF